MAAHGAAHLGRGGDADLAGAGLLLEGVDARLAVVALGRHGGHVGPVEVAQDLSHGLGLVEVGGHGAGEVIIARLVAELGAGGGVADLGDLEEPEQVGHLEKYETDKYNIKWQVGHLEKYKTVMYNLKWQVGHLEKYKTVTYYIKWQVGHLKKYETVTYNIKWQDGHLEKYETVTYNIKWQDGHLEKYKTVMYNLKWQVGHLEKYKTVYN